MEALVRVVDNANKCFEANCSRWMDVISSAHNLLTCRDLERFTGLCNDGYESVEGEYFLYEHWQSLFLGRPSYIWIRNGIKGHKEVEESDKEGSNDKSWGGSIESTGGRKYFLTHHQWIAYFEWFGPEEAANTADSRYVHMLLSSLPCVNQCLIRGVHSIITLIWRRLARDQGYR
jgi:hypothetical protein